MILTTTPIPTLRTMTRAQIIANISAYLTATYTKHQLIVGIANDQETETETTTRTYFADGQIDKTVLVIKDIETGDVLSKVVTNWDYYTSGEVKRIIVKYTNPSDGELGRRTITHYKDGRQPTAEVTGQIAGAAAKQSA